MPCHLRPERVVTATYQFGLYFKIYQNDHFMRRIRFWRHLYRSILEISKFFNIPEYPAFSTCDRPFFNCKLK